MIKHIPAGGEIFSDYEEKEDESREMAPEALCSHLYILQILPREEFAFMPLPGADKVHFSGKKSYALCKEELFPPMQSSHLPLVNSNSSLPVILPLDFSG